MNRSSDVLCLLACPAAAECGIRLNIDVDIDIETANEKAL